MDEVIEITWTRGDRLAKARRIGNVSTEDMADFLGVSRKTINNYEADRTPVRTAFIRLWAERCGVPFEWIMASETERVSLTPPSPRINVSHTDPSRVPASTDATRTAA